MYALIAGLLIAAAGSALDVYSTVRCIGVGLVEANPLLTDSHGKYILWRGIAIKGLTFAAPILASVLVPQAPWLIVACGGIGGGAGAYCWWKNNQAYKAWIAQKTALRG